MKNKKKLVTICILALVVVGTGGYFTIQKLEASKEKPPANERKFQVSKGNITVGIEGTGKIEVQNRSYSLPKEAAVSGVLVKEGDWVKQDQTLMELNPQESQKYQQSLEEQYKSIEEKRNTCKSERELFLESMPWELANNKNASRIQYENDLWKLNDSIGDLEWDVSNAKYQRDYVNDDELSCDAVEKLEKELEQKCAERNDLQSRRETQKQQEEDPAYQKTQRDEKLGEWDGKIESCNKELEALRLQLERVKSLKIVAEKEGVVLKVSNTPEEGCVVEIGQRDDMVVRLSVEQEDIVDVKEKQEVEIIIDAYPDMVFKGKVVKRVLAADSNGKYAALAAIENKEGAEILPGMNGSGTMVVKQKTDILTLSNKAIELKGGKQYIKVKDASGNLKSKEIQTGFSDGKLTEIISGAKEGDTAVTQVKL